MSATATIRDRPLSFHWKPIDPTWIDGLSLPAFRSKKQAEAFISILTEAIVVGRGEPDRWISYSRRAAFYSGQGRYHGTAYTFATVPPAIDELAALNLLEHDRRPPGSIGRQSRFRASPELMATLDKPLPVVFNPLEVVRLKDAEGRLVEYRDTAATERMRRNLETINEALRAERIDLEAPGVVTENDIIRRGDQKLHKQLQLLWRVFNRGRFTLGGRSYGGWWQTVRRIDRSYISLDGEPTVEHDYEQLHPRLLYAITA